ncbi:glycosyltransferase family 9 protein [Thalassomonas actiniarum]|uniref:Glycosyltransferase family 9 protein n=1 Tax=Thalassomonas actiniarum TaxID=485447 RepID=A0AAF0C346_9GAMM|nr:glycosyltransferase family 9 protein [Thalassomonas actiniarum]WDD98545.1 glycosyltransferase family 9 protein [Thalassomonas actiniarum]
MPLISSQQFQRAKRLLFMSPLALGDFLYLKTFLGKIKAEYPHIELDIWQDDNRNNSQSWRLLRSQTIEQWIQAEADFTRSYGCCDSPARQRQQINRAQKLNYDLIIIQGGNRGRQYSALAREISPDAFIATYKGSSRYYGLLDKWDFRHSDKTCQLNKKALPENYHVTDRYYQIIQAISGISLAHSEFMPVLKLPQSSESRATDWLTKAFSDPARQGPVIFLNHLSTDKKRDWQPGKLFELIAKMGQKNPDSRFIINIIKEHQNEISRAIQSTPELQPFQVATFTAESHFFDLPSLIAQADLVITVETAIMHFAAATGRPLIAMMRQKKPYWAPPASKTTKVVYTSKKKDHISDIGVDNIIGAINTMQTALNQPPAIVSPVLGDIPSLKRA